jgi:hypothetical protein
LQSLFADGCHMFWVDIDKRDVMAGARQSPADDAADRSGADYDQSITHFVASRITD